MADDKWTVDVATSDHDAVKVGVLVQRVSRVHLSKVDFPDPYDAQTAAAQLAVSMHGGMPTDVVVCI